MKKLLGIVVLGLLLSGNAYGNTSFKKNTDLIYLFKDMNYFIKKGYQIVAEDTRGIRTAYVLKKGTKYVGCRTEGLSRKIICYKVSLTENN
tara:strand:- start:81 stop:353 length:273 start_codon:yes stop_codon:yes gene_type:complete